MGGGVGGPGTARVGGAALIPHVHGCALRLTVECARRQELICHHLVKTGFQHMITPRGNFAGPRPGCPKMGHFGVKIILS